MRSSTAKGLYIISFHAFKYAVPVIMLALLSGLLQHMSVAQLALHVIIVSCVSSIINAICYHQ
jgi:hypothetical protein